ncbi:MAG TPA: SpvB/TcaC N-terminal domain-containing protein [Bacteroidales bacterium]|nr:SpvB/TcaC N-terminal domain-containing protein [Bacteroidales bacterium]
MKKLTLTSVVILTILVVCVFFYRTWPGSRVSAKEAMSEKTTASGGITVTHSNVPDSRVNRQPEKQTLTVKPALTQHYKPHLLIPGRTMKSAVFTPEVTQRLSMDGAALEIPAGALSAVKNISVTGLLADDLPPIPAEISNITNHYAGFRFLPHGTLFAAPATIAMAYDESLIPEGFTADDIYTLYFDEADQKWKALERDSIDHTNKLVVSNTLHFTDMINGIIKVPESPETGGYSPTTIKDIKAADPAAGIVQIAQPSVNSTGDIDLSFPFKLPAGRAGMEPQIALQYSNNGGSSWTGFGWNLSVSGISVDASWGVPRYLPDKESETYLMGGTQLTPLAHRTEYVARTAEKRFYPRIEGGFSKIIRHGSNPTEYWWEVTSKNGSSSFYGGTPETGIIRDAVTATSAGNIAYWALVQVRDVHGNSISYTYEKPEGYGEQLYISEISYTGFGTEQGPYKVSFLRSDAANTFERQDARVDARLGMIVRDKDLLRRVNITFNNEPVRSYTLQYKEGAFSKTMLESVTELNSEDEAFYTHRFEYYDDVQAANGYVPFAQEKKLTLQDDNLKNPFLNPVNLFFDNVSALGGSGSGGGSGNLALTVGFNNFKLWDKSLSAGGSGGYSGSTGESFLSLVDINGDGLTDKVFKKDNHVYYRPNISSTNSNVIYGEAKIVQGINYISLSKTNAFSWGLEANPPFSFVGYSNIKSKTKTEIYFSDFNGDGLIDLAKKGIVYFNHINQQGEPVFSVSSALTPNPLNTASSIDSSMLPNAGDEQRELEAQFPLQDAVKMWQAPYKGWVKINAPVRLLEDTSLAARTDTLKDGVKVSIQYRGQIVWSTEIGPDDYNFKYPTIDSIFVNKEDRLYFRVQSRFNGSYDQVFWDPEITYSSINGNYTLAKYEDVNKKKIGRYKASEDYLLCGMQSVGMPKDGMVRFLTHFSKGMTTDSVRVSIIRTDTSGVKSDVYTMLLPDTAETSDLPINLDLSVLKDETYLFQVESGSNIDWTKINWDIYFEYTSIADGTPVTSNNGEPMLAFKAVPDFTTMYNNPMRHSPPLVIDSAFIKKMGVDSVDTLPHTLKITPLIEYDADLFNIYLLNDSLTLTVKTQKQLLGEKVYWYLFDRVINFDTLKVDVSLGDTLYIDYHCNKFRPSQYIKTADIKYYTDKAYIASPSVFSAIPGDYEIFGKLYRRWGQFNYDGSGTRANEPINESLLKVSEGNSNVDVSSADELDGNVHNTLSDPFVIAIPYASKGYFLGADEYVYMGRSVISSSRRGEKSVYVAPFSVAGSGLIAFDKVTEDVTKSTAAGGGAGPASVSASHSSGTSTILKDMMDMNGDRYPDLISVNNIQYTSHTGAIAGSAVSHSLGAHKAESNADGGTLGGSYVVAKFDNAMKPCGTAGDKKVKASMGDNLQMDKNAKASENTAKSSIGLSVDFSKNTDATVNTWMDINGDGLPDWVSSNGSVRLNLGYSFAEPETWNFDAIRKGKSIDYGGGLGINIKNNSISAGVGISKTLNETTVSFIDINGDGLPDLVKGKSVMFNTGCGFAAAVNWDGLGAIDAGKSIGESANAGFTVAIGIPIIMIKVCINPSGSVSRGVSYTTTQLSDFDGDGMPDFLSSEKEGELYIKSSTINRTNMLKTVYRPLGSNFTVDYMQTPANYQHPGGKWALASVKTFDGLTGDGVDSSLVTYEYLNGFYNRRERQFYGFDTVKTHFHDTGNGGKIYRSVVQHFNNNSYYTHGNMISEMLVDGSGRMQTGSENRYSLRNIYTGEVLPATYAQNDTIPLFVSLDTTIQHVYEGAEYPQISTRVAFVYDKMGNVTGYTDYAAGNSNDRVSVDIRYHSVDGKYIYSVPASQDVTTSTGLMRKRATQINEWGDITRIEQLISDGNMAVFDMEYNQYGNLTKITRPANYKGERMWYAYTYDEALHSLVTSVTDAFGYGSSTTYDYKWGAPLETTDKNKQKMRYVYDASGRVKTITGPYEIASGKPYTIAFNYYPLAKTPYAQTLHYDAAHNGDIETFTFSDGLGRPVQVKKIAELHNGEGSATSGFVVSGKVMYDAFGRAVKAYQPVFEAGNAETYNPTADNVQPTVTTYDVLDRTLAVTLPDGAATKRGYGIAAYNSENMYVDTLTDALGHKALTYTDAKGRQVASILKSAEGDITTHFSYNALGEVLSVTDPKGNQTLSVYDLSGRRTSVNQPDGGLTEFIYDNAGNILKKITANLRKTIPNGGAIVYKYDYERLAEIVYPRNIQNRVQYTYGAPDASYGRVGRITVVQDASGGQEFFYGPMGEVVKTIRTIQLGESDMRTWVWSAEYDSWNRVQNMTYPDGEVVTYTYNRAGNLQSMKGVKLGSTYKYIDHIGYDKYEKQVYLQYGNGSVTTYNYDRSPICDAALGLVPLYS